MRILFLGDIVGRVAREAVRDNVANLRQSLNLDFVIVNGENAAHGFGITAAMVEELLDNGVDVITTGNHVWDKSEILSYVENQPRLLRPINFPPGTPGKGAGLFTVGDKNILVINVMGQLFMQTLDDPFAAIEREISACPLSEMADAIIVDVHAEASSEKWPWVTFAMAVLRSSSAPIPIYRLRMHKSCRLAQPIKPMLVCAAIMIV
jgi:metallophosphoesterase (TIGR00282 family)